MHLHTYRCATGYVTMETGKQKHVCTHAHTQTVHTNIQIGRLKMAVHVSWSERLKLFVQMKEKKTTVGKRSGAHICKH